MFALRRFAFALTLAIAAELWAPAPATLAAGSPPNRASEYEVKATFLFNFVKFTAWPAAASGDGVALDVCVFGSSPVSPTLDGFGGQTVDGRKLAVKRIVDPADLPFCHLVFVSHSEKARTAVALQVTKHLPVLTVGEDPQFLASGGIINFVAVDNRVRFDINQAAAERVNLKLSAHLLRLARRIGDGRQP